MCKCKFRGFLDKNANSSGILREKDGFVAVIVVAAIVDFAKI